MTDLLLTLKGFCSRSPLPHPLPIAHLAGLGGKAESLLAFRVLPSRLAFEAGGLAFCMAGAHGSPRLIGHFPALEFRGARVGSANFGFGLIGMLPAQKWMGITLEPLLSCGRHLRDFFGRAFDPLARARAALRLLRNEPACRDVMLKCLESASLFVESARLKAALLEDNGGLSKAGGVARLCAGHLNVLEAAIQPFGLDRPMAIQPQPPVEGAPNVLFARWQIGDDVYPINSCAHPKADTRTMQRCQS